MCQLPRITIKRSALPLVFTVILTPLQENIPKTKTDSWFGNNGFWSKLDGRGEGCLHVLSRMWTNIALYNFAPASTGKRKAGRPRKYGESLGSVDDGSAKWKEKIKRHIEFFCTAKKRSASVFTDRLLKTIKRQARVFWYCRKTRYVALMTTVLTLSVEQIVEYYGALEDRIRIQRNQARDLKIKISSQKCWCGVESL